MNRILPELPSIGLLALAAGLSAWAWDRVPERVAVHWDLYGNVDRYGGRVEGLLAVPLIGIAIYLVLRLVPLLGMNHEQFARAYDVLRTSLMAFLVAVHALMIANAVGVHVDVPRWIAALTGLLFVVMGNTMGKLRPNAYAGVRTPWTLTSKLSWTKTHRLAGFLFIGTGLVVAILALISAPLALGGILGLTTATTLISAAYSWQVWRNDPDRGLS